MAGHRWKLRHGNVQSAKRKRRGWQRKFPHPPTKIVIDFVPPEVQRYRTVGDWQQNWDTGELHLTISQMSQEASFCVALHELIEAWFCGQHSVTSDDVDKADSLPLEKGYAEHGDMPHVCYHQEHDFAWCIERLVAHELGLDWTKYEEELDATYKRTPRKKPRA